MIKHKTVEDYYNHIEESKKPMFQYLRDIALDMGFDEQIKWYLPVYTVHGRNAIGLGTTKDNVSIWFFEGNRINDHLNVLINAQEGKTEGMRHWRFTTIEELNMDDIRDYFTQAIEIAANPIKKIKTPKAVIIPSLLQNALKKDPSLKKAFDQFTNYKQREFCEHIDLAKREATKLSRLEKIIPMILEGVGLSDKYR